MSKILAIIPARGGSKGIKRKNVMPFKGSPLISWTVRQAILELGVENVIVSTEDTEIARIAKDAGHIYSYIRPERLATDKSSTEPVMEHVYEWYKKEIGKTPTYIMLLQPTSPIRNHGRVIDAVTLMDKKKFDSALSVFEEHAFHWRDFDAPKPTYDPQKRPRRQDIEDKDRIYRENGSIYITKTECFEKGKCRISGSIGLILMDQHESVEIDTLTDWKINENFVDLLK
jgi:CMP-N,N'-diacetyllegionaminic acid synthase